MKLTKYEHACFSVEKNGRLIVVDPGGYTTDFIAPANVAAIVVTHDHPDHYDHDQIAAIIDKNPDAVIIGPRDVTTKIEVFTTREVNGGDSIELGGFELAFFGDTHATIYPGLPTGGNVGVMIDDLVYFPGDSLTVPSTPVDTLALPVSAPWLKFDEAVDFLKAVAPRFVFPTHDAILSGNGRALVDSMLPMLVKDAGIDYERIDGHTIEL